MIRSKRFIYILSFALVILTASAALFYGNVAVYLFAKSNGLNISYARLKAVGAHEFVFKDFKALENKRGMGLTAQDAKITLISNSGAPLKPTADIELCSVNFITGRAQKEASYGNIDGLISLPFSGLLRYKTVSGKITSIQNGISVNDFRASGDDIRFSFSGTLTDESNINADISIDFAKNMLGKIPPELTNMVLKGGEGQWKTLSVKLDGDLSKPSIRVTGKMFRLNIGVK